MGNTSYSEGCMLYKAVQNTINYDVAETVTVNVENHEVMKQVIAVSNISKSCSLN